MTSYLFSGVSSPTSKPVEKKIAYVNGAFENSDERLSNKQGRTSNTGDLNGAGTSSRTPVQSHPLTMNGVSRLSEIRQQDSHNHSTRNINPSGNGLASHFSDNSSNYQVIKWAPFRKDAWSSVYNASGKEL